MHHVMYSPAQNGCTALEVHSASPIHPPPQASGNYKSCYCLYSCAFSRMSYSWNQTVCYLFKLIISQFFSAPQFLGYDLRSLFFDLSIQCELELDDGASSSHIRLQYSSFPCRTDFCYGEPVSVFQKDNFYPHPSPAWNRMGFCSDFHFEDLLRV